MIVLDLTETNFQRRCSNSIPFLKRRFLSTFKYFQFSIFNKNNKSTIIIGDLRNLTQLIVTKAENVLKKNINTPSFKIWFDIQDNINNSQFKINTILYGFKNPKNDTLCRLRHLEAGITQTPITILNSDLNKYGYIIKDISDTSKSFQKIWEVTIM